MKAGYIYEIRNKLNNKVYIGSTTNDNRRKKEHFNELRKNRHHSNYLQNSFNKYGEENFEFKVIAKFTDIDRKKLFEEEKYYMNKYNSMDSAFGYNMVEVSENGGCDFSEDQRLIMSIKAKDSKQILAINKNNDTFKYHSISYASRELNLTLAEIQRVLNNKQKYAGNFIFVHEDSYDKNFDYSTIIGVDNRNGSKILQYDLNGKLINKWDKQKIAAQKLNISNGSVSAALKDRQTHAGEFIWMYEDDSKNNLTLDEKISKFKENNNTNKTILKYDAKMTLIKRYNNKSEIEKDYSLKNIRRCICGEIKTYKGFIWKYDN
jgi:group I intron endonuclease